MSSYMPQEWGQSEKNMAAFVGRLLATIAGEHFVEISQPAASRGFKSTYYTADAVESVLRLLRGQRNLYINICSQAQQLGKRPDGNNCVDAALFYVDLETEEAHNSQVRISLDDAQALLERFFTEYPDLRPYAFYAIFTGRGVQVVFLLSERLKRDDFEALCKSLKKVFHDVDYVDKAVFSWNRLMRIPFSLRDDLTDENHNPIEHKVEFLYYNDASETIEPAFIFALESKIKHEKELEKYKEFREELRNIISDLKRRAKIEDACSLDVAKQNGNYSLVHCPFHTPDQNPSFIIYHNYDGEIAYDAHDGERYDVFSLLMKMHRLTFMEAVERVAERYGYSLPEKVRPALQKKRKAEEADQPADFPFPGATEVYRDAQGVVYVYNHEFWVQSLFGKPQLIRVSPYFEIKKIEGADFYVAKIFVDPNDPKLIRFNKKFLTYSAIANECSFYTKKELAALVYKYAMQNIGTIEQYKYGVDLAKRIFVHAKNANFFDGFVVNNDEYDYGEMFVYNVDDEYMDFIRRVFDEDSRLSFILTVALAPLFGGNGIVILSGPSGAGKTKLMQFATSFFVKGFARSISDAGTQVYLQETNPHTWGVDEANALPIRVLEGALFMSAHDEFNLRSTATRTARIARSKGGVIITTSEKEFKPKDFTRVGASRRHLNIVFNNLYEISPNFADFVYRGEYKYGAAAYIYEKLVEKGLDRKYNQRHFVTEIEVLNAAYNVALALEELWGVSLAKTKQLIKEYAQKEVVKEINEKESVEEVYLFLQENHSNFYSQENDRPRQFFGWYNYAYYLTTPQGIQKLKNATEAKIAEEEGMGVVDAKVEGVYVTTAFFETFFKKNSRYMKKVLMRALEAAGILKGKAGNVWCPFIKKAEYVYLLDFSDYIPHSEQSEPEPPAPTDPPTPPPTPPTPPPTPSTPPEANVVKPTFPVVGGEEEQKIAEKLVTESPVINDFTAILNAQKAYVLTGTSQDLHRLGTNVEAKAQIAKMLYAIEQLDNSYDEHLWVPIEKVHEEYLSFCKMNNMEPYKSRIVDLSKSQEFYFHLTHMLPQFTKQCTIRELKKQIKEYFLTNPRPMLRYDQKLLLPLDFVSQVEYNDNFTEDDVKKYVEYLEKIHASPKPPESKVEVKLFYTYYTKIMPATLDSQTFWKLTQTYLPGLLTRESITLGELKELITQCFERFAPIDELPF